MKKKGRIRILLADDHRIVRDGLRALFASDPQFSIAGEAADGEQAVHLAETLKPDIAILDISMPKRNGIEATPIIKQRSPHTKILILTVHQSEEFVYEMINAGANGYVLKNADKEEIFAAVRALAAGGSFFSPSVSKLLIEGVLRRSKELRAPTSTRIGNLTPREIEILRHIVEGQTSREISERLNISFSTVNSHRTNLMKKLGIHDTAGLVRYAIQHNIVTVTP